LLTLLSEKFSGVHGRKFRRISCSRAPRGGEVETENAIMTKLNWLQILFRSFQRLAVFRYVLAALLVAPLAVLAAEPSRERISFNENWLFIKGEPTNTTDSLTYAKVKPWFDLSGADLTTNTFDKPDGLFPVEPPFAQASADDRDWRKLNLPHDWAIEGPFEQRLEGSTGKLKFSGPVWYRKHFDVPATDSGRKIFLDMDGAMSYAQVWLNGRFVGGWPYGYASFELDLTPFLKMGGENVLAIRLDSPAQSSRWYPGAGLYRNVWLVKTAPVHIAHWGTFVTTPDINKNAATVKIEVNLQNESDAHATVAVKNEVFEINRDGSRGKAVASINADGVQITAHNTGKTTAQISFKNPRLWSIEKPDRYCVVTSVIQNGKTADVYETPFGVRTLEFSATKGFLLNGEHVKFNGVCDHHDLGALGSAVNVRALERQLEILKLMGCNAIRTSHNPPAPELLDLCDRMGLVIMDETFDCWARQKRPGDYHLAFPDWHEKDTRALVRRDRNHPSVVMWSIGNEIPEFSNARGIELGKELAAIVHSEDTTRPVTSACNDTRSGYNGYQHVVDVFGYNYKPGEYTRFRATNSNIALFGSETASCVSSRGEYFFPVSNEKGRGRADFQVSSYDLYAPGWATTPDSEFRGQDKNPFVMGEFVWTGFDYIGEPTPYDSDSSNLLNYTDPAEKARAEQELKEIGKIRVPSRSSYFGIIDLAGFPKDRYYLYQAHWRPDFPMAHILPHWNWPDRVGQVTPVHVYTSGDEAELFLNGKSLGKKKKGEFEYRIRWDDVVYQPGELKVVAYRHGKRWATDVMKTTGPATKLSLVPDRKKILGDGKDLSFVTLRVEDKNGLMVPRSKNQIHFDVEGSGEIVATDNGDATDLNIFQSKDRKAYNGLALVIVRATKPGAFNVVARAEGLKDVSVRITAMP
jgi:beta-galactosidase